MTHLHVISATAETETTPMIRVLQRIAGIFARSHLNVSQMSVETKEHGISYFNIVVHSDEKTIDKLVKQLERIIELSEVKVNNQKEGSVF